MTAAVNQSMYVTHMITTLPSRVTNTTTVSWPFLAFGTWIIKSIIYHVIPPVLNKISELHGRSVDYIILLYFSILLWQLEYIEYLTPYIPFFISNDPCHQKSHSSCLGLQHLPPLDHYEEYHKPHKWDTSQGRCCPRCYRTLAVGLQGGRAGTVWPPSISPTDPTLHTVVPFCRSCFILVQDLHPLFGAGPPPIPCRKDPFESSRRI